MTVSYFTHPDCALHEMGPGHVEQPERLRVIHKALQEHGLLHQMRTVDPHPGCPRKTAMGSYSELPRLAGTAATPAGALSAH